MGDLSYSPKEIATILAIFAEGLIHAGVIPADTSVYTLSLHGHNALQYYHKHKEIYSRVFEGNDNADDEG